MLLKDFCKDLVWLCLAFMLGCVGYAVLVAAWTVEALPNQIDARLALMQSAVLQEVHVQSGAVLNAVDLQLSGLRRDANSQLSGFERDAFTQIADVQRLVDRRLGDSLSRADTALSTVTGLRSDLQPILTHVSAVTAKADDAAGVLLARNALPAQLLGLTAAAKITFGQTAKTMRSIQEATPGLLATAQKIGDNSDRATARVIGNAEESQKFLHNLVENTTPLPKFIRYPAQVIGLLGSAALPVISIEKLAKVDSAASTVVR